MQNKCYELRKDLCDKHDNNCDNRHECKCDCSCDCNSHDKCYDCGTNFKEAVCIHTDKVFDSCRDKDCLENIRVYLTQSGQEVVDRAINVKCVKAETIWVFTDVNRSKYNNVIWVST